MKKVKLGDICDKIGSGATPRGGKNSYLGGNISLIRSMNVFDNGFSVDGLAKINDKQANNLKNVIVEECDVLLNITGASVARCCNVPNYVLPARVNQHVSIIRPNKKKCSPVYLRYYLIQKAIKAKLLAISIGSSREAITKEFLEDFEINLPDLSTQTAIAHILSSLDDKIELNNKINKELENLARTIYEYWFVQNADKSWVRKKLKDLGEFKNGANYEKANEIGERVKIVNVRDISSSSIFIQVENLDEIILPKNEIEKYLLNENDIIFARSGIPGAIRLIEKTEEYVIFCGFAIRFKLNDENLKEYLYFPLKQNEEFAKNKSGGSIMPNIRQDSLKDISVSIPVTEILEKFNKIVSPIFVQIIKNRQENAELAQLRDFLLPLLMNGQVKVKEEPIYREKPTVGKRLTKQQVFMRLVLAAYILDTICDEPTAGRVKFEKLLFLCLYCAKIAIKTNFHRQDYGPYDSNALFSIEKQLSDNKWFKKNTVKDQYRAYVRLGKSSNYKQYVDTNFNPSQKIVIDKILRLFRTLNTERCEIVATLYGAWNDFLIEGIQPTDEQIVDEVLTSWHDKKKRIDRQRWFKALEWMRDKAIIPVGFGSSTKK